jgi:hypothetical protein
MISDQGFKLRPEAAQDITDIWEYIAEESPLAASAGNSFESTWWPGNGIEPTTFVSGPGHYARVSRFASLLLATQKRLLATQKRKIVRGSTFVTRRAGK